MLVWTREHFVEKNVWNFVSLFVVGEHPAVLCILCKYLCKQAKCIMCPVLSLLYLQKAHNKWPTLAAGRRQLTAGASQLAARIQDTGNRQAGRQAARSRSNSSPIESQNKRAAVCHAQCTPPNILLPFIVFRHKVLAFGTFAIMHMLSYSHIVWGFLAFDLPAVWQHVCHSLTVHVCLCVCVQPETEMKHKSFIA